MTSILQKDWLQEDMTQISEICNNRCRCVHDSHIFVSKVYDDQFHGILRPSSSFEISYIILLVRGI
jgi:hypothetical protein